MGDRRNIRDINRMLDTYLDELPANRRGVFPYLGGLMLSRKTKKKKAESAPGEVPSQEKVLTEEMPDDRIIIEPGPSFIERTLASIRNIFKGPAREPDRIGEMEVVDLPVIEGGIEEAAVPEEELPPVPKQKRSAVGLFLDSLFGRTREEAMVNEGEDARVTKLVLYKDRTEKEVRFLLRLIDTLYPRVYKRTRDEFEKSSDYQIFKKVRERYIIEED